MAGAPEKQYPGEQLEEDIAHLRIKQDAGADYMMTQLCFDVEAFKRWRDKVRAAGITIPIDVGVIAGAE
jgi:methylenetetrahydrofolate reductase (NADPH)